MKQAITLFPRKIEVKLESTAFNPNCMININMHVNKDAIYLRFP